MQLWPGGGCNAKMGKLNEEWESTSLDTGTVLPNMKISRGFGISDFDTRLVWMSISVQGLSQVSYRG